MYPLTKRHSRVTGGGEGLQYLLPFSRGGLRRGYQCLLRFILKQKRQVEPPDAAWWYELAKACGLLACRDPHALPTAITQFEKLLEQKPDAGEAKEGLRLAEGMSME